MAIVAVFEYETTLAVMGVKADDCRQLIIFGKRGIGIRSQVILYAEGHDGETERGLRVRLRCEPKCRSGESRA